MLTWLDVDGTQDIVYTSQLDSLAINGSCPSWIVDLREDQHAALAAIHVIGEAVRFITGDCHDAGSILFHSLAQLLLELRIGYGLMAQVDLADGLYLLVGIIYISDLIHEPAIAINIGILDGYGLSALQGEDKVLRVQHVEHRTDAVAVHLCHVATSLRHSAE